MLSFDLKIFVSSISQYWIYDLGFDVKKSYGLFVIESRFSYAWTFEIMQIYLQHSFSKYTLIYVYPFWGTKTLKS